MRRIFALTLASAFTFLSLAPSASAEDWPTDMGPDGGTGFIRGTPYKTHSLRWTTKLSDLPSGVFPMSPLLVFRGIVIVNGASTNSVLGLNAATGEVVWRFAPDPRKPGAFGGYPNANQPMVADGVFYTTANNGILYALNPLTGRKIWSYEVTETDYNKAIARVAVCNGKVFFDTVGGIPAKGQPNVYAIDVKTGKKAWSVYSGSPDWPGEGNWPDFPRNSQPRDLAKLGRSTRRFEARPGLACANNRVQVYGEDGVLRLHDVADGSLEGTYNVRHASMDLGFAVDGTVGVTDPITGDLLRASLNNRLVRLMQPAIEAGAKCTGADPCGETGEELKVHPGWRSPYGNCSDSNTRCGVVTASRGDVIPTYRGSRNDGIIGGAVFSAGMDIGTWEDGRRVVYAPNHDGYLYAMDFDDPIGPNGEPSVFKVPFDPIPEHIRDAPYTNRSDGTNLYMSNDGEHCMKAERCRNGPWEHRASNVSSPVTAGGVVYVAASMAHKMMGFDWKTGERVFEYEVKWDDKSQYPPFGDTKPKPYIDIDLLVQVTPAHDGKNLYFTANNGVVYAFSTQENIARPRKNLAILGSGVVPFIPKWTEAIGAFDYVWTPGGDWYNPGYTSDKSATASQAPPGFADSTTPFGYKGAQRSYAMLIPLSALILLLLAALTVPRLRHAAIGVSLNAAPAAAWVRREWKLAAAVVAAAIAVIAISSMAGSPEGSVFSEPDIGNMDGLPLQPERRP